MSTPFIPARYPNYSQHEYQQRMFENDHGYDGFMPEVHGDRVTDDEDDEEEYEDDEEEEIREEGGEEEEDEEEGDDDDGEDGEEEVDDYDEGDVDDVDDEDVGEEAEEDEETAEDQEPDQDDEPNQLDRADEKLHPAQDLVQFPKRFESSRALINSKYLLGCPSPGCKKTFDQESNLRLHAMVHTCYRPHVCLPCQARHKRMNELKVHFRNIHTALEFDKEKHVRTKDFDELRSEAFINRYGCTRCPKMFETEDHVKTHFLADHPRHQWSPNMCYFKTLKFVNNEIDQWLSLRRDIESVILHAKLARRKLV
ncbi:hypothetical protein PGT21_006745 [Puccinia graminis f. sp. tritici]|uniref:C2H2-type domain-containing protein n=1 Tax=Puccinia graminis f. sp. tritici TaxID=56615 RepID=A0A5B0MF08_PUCGR|nr:hypothetical protein PGT21_006745 [Puccinia graminis f. sp. tritici]